MTGMRAPQTIWIVNNDLAPTHGVARDITGAAVTTFDSGRKDTYSESGTIAVPKNREFARLLLQNYEGHHSCVFMNRQRKDFLIKSSAHYTNNNGIVSNIHIGVAGMKSWSIFASLRQALLSLNEVDETIRQNKVREEEAKAKKDAAAKALAEEKKVNEAIAKKVAEKKAAEAAAAAEAEAPAEAPVEEAPAEA